MEAYARRAETMRRIEGEHEKNDDPSPDFISTFAEEYQPDMFNALFDAGEMMDTFMNLQE